MNGWLWSCSRQIWAITSRESAPVYAPMTSTRYFMILTSFENTRRWPEISTCSLHHGRCQRLCADAATTLQQAAIFGREERIFCATV